MTFWQILTQYFKFLMPRPLKRGILGAFIKKILINMLLCVVRILMKQTLLPVPISMGHGRLVM